MAAMRQYFSLKGRSSRREWWIVEILIILGIKLNNMLLTGVLRDFDNDGDLFVGTSRLWLVGVVALLWLNFASNVRRLHDRGKSGWWSLLYLFPGLGQVWCIIECGLMEGQAQANRYGPTPAVAAHLAKISRREAARRAAADAAMTVKGAGRQAASPPQTARATHRPTVARNLDRPIRLPQSRRLRAALALGALVVIGLATLAFTTGIPVPVAVVPVSPNPDVPVFDPSGYTAKP